MNTNTDFTLSELEEMFWVFKTLTPKDGAQRGRFHAIENKLSDRIVEVRTGTSPEATPVPRFEKADKSNSYERIKMIAEYHGLSVHEFHDCSKEERERMAKETGIPYISRERRKTNGKASIASAEANRMAARKSWLKAKRISEYHKIPVNKFQKASREEKVRLAEEANIPYGAFKGRGETNGHLNQYASPPERRFGPVTIKAGDGVISGSVMGETV